MQVGERGEVKRVDVREVLESKFPSLKGKVPGFVISYLRRIVHEDEVNLIFREYGHLWGLDFAETVLRDYFKVKIDVSGREKLPENGRVIFASNHPIGSIDGMVLMVLLGRHYGDVKVPVNDVLMNVDNLEGFFIPVNKVQGQGQERRMSSMLNEVLEGDAPVLFFPSGQCSRRQSDGTIRDNDWKKSFVAKARECHRDVVPLHYDGQLSRFFLNLAYYRKKFGIKTNIEMLYLVDEMFKQKNKNYTVTIGDAIPYGTFDESRSDREWAAWVKEISYGLTQK